jgi:GntR family transcriptional regulator, transcriptional repressor for pyruvate dehydrogenase complex
MKASGMKRREARTVIEIAALELRKIVLDLAPGEFIGSEEALIARLGCSRSTVRQVARLLEREGLLKVRRGINGGYFGARPDAGTIEATVSTYLETLDIDTQDTTIVAATLWVEAMRKAAAAGEEDRQRMAGRMIARIKAIKDSATFNAVRECEMQSQGEVFELARSAYIKLIFDINVAFSRRRFPEPLTDDTSEAHLRFVRAWKDAKLLEMSAISQGDAALAELAGRYSRQIWHERIRSRFPR